MSVRSFRELTKVELWVVGRYRGPEPPADEQLLRGDPPGVLAPWEFLGVFSSESKAVAACSQRLDFVAPAVLDERQPDEATGWPRAHYPLAKAGA